MAISVSLAIMSRNSQINQSPSDAIGVPKSLQNLNFCTNSKIK